VVINDSGSQLKDNKLKACIYSEIYLPKSSRSDSRPIISAIRCYLRYDQRVRYTNIHAISYALINCHHLSIGFSLYHALYGLDLITHGSQFQLLRNLQLIDEPPAQLDRDDLKLVRGQLKKNIKGANEKRAAQYNLRLRPIE